MHAHLQSHTILLTIAGSRAYGVHTPASDIDLRGVALPPVRRLLSLAKDFEQADSVDEISVFRADLDPQEQEIADRTGLEGSVYGLRKFARLASDCNPNILDVLFADARHLRRVTPAGERLREHRDLFLSSRARHSYAGYARSQLKRIQTHRRWLLEPPQGEPTRAEFGLPEMPEIPGEQLSAAEAAVRKKIDGWEIDYGELPGSQVVALQERMAQVLAEQELGSDALWASAARHVGLAENLIEHMQKERSYKAAHRAWKQYAHWKRTRNPDRAALEAAHGYDTKHAAHLVRLLRMGREIVTTGQVHVWRGERDADELRAIRQGAWTYERLMQEVDDELKALRTASKGAWAVPEKADRDAIDQLVHEILAEHVGVTPRA